MDRFVSNTTNRVDKKGRVSIPANFRSVLGDQSVLHVTLGLEHPLAEAGGREFMDSNLQRLARMDPFSEEYEMWSFCLVGDAAELKIDTEGRIILTDNIRDHTGISDAVTFVGMGNHFQLWEPECFQSYRETARERVRLMRRNLGAPRQTNSPESQAGTPTPPNQVPGKSAGNLETDT